MLLKGTQQKAEVNKVLIIDEYELAVAATMPKDKKAKKLHELNELAFKDFLLLVNHKRTISKTAFHLIKNYKMEEYPEGICHLTWEHLVEKYAQNSHMKQSTDDSNVWIKELEDLYNQMNEVGFTQVMSDDDFRLHVMGNLTKEYKASLIDVENCFYKTESENLTIKVMHQKLNARYKRMEAKREEVEEEEKVLVII